MFNSFITMWMPLLFEAIKQSELGKGFGLNGEIIESAASLFFIGSGAGAVIFPFISDKFGRKKSMFYAILFGGILMCLTGLAMRFWQLKILFFLIGFSITGYEVISLVYVTEISGNTFPFMYKCI